jgi:hypothetical protein
MKLTHCTLPVTFALLAGLAGPARSGDDKTDIKGEVVRRPERADH